MAQSLEKKRMMIRAAGREVFIGTLVALLVAGGTLGGFYLGRQSATGSVPWLAHIVTPAGISRSDDQADMSLFWQAWNIVDQNFYGIKNTNDQKRVEGAVAGMVASLKDPYTLYFGPSQNKQFKSDLEGSFGGIGAELTVKDGLLTIVSALDGTPAFAAGLKGQDVIVEIDGKKTADMELNDAIDKIRGEKGSSVDLTIARAGVEKPFTVKLTRDTIVVKSVKTQDVGPDGSIAYIKVNQFGQDTVDLFTSALNAAKSSGKKGVVVDLRNNPGGYLEAAITMIGSVIPQHPDSTEQKLKDRVAVLERSKDGKETVRSAVNDPLLADVPMVVLVNGGSASASEIFSGAMKDYKRATLVGTKTFGKGSVQDLIDLQNHGSIKVTIAKWFTPLGSGIDGKGIEPDVKVELPDNTQPSVDDAQMAKALELLQQQIK